MSAGPVSSVANSTETVADVSAPASFELRSTRASATPASIVRSWLRSPGHRAILLDGRYDDVGIGIALGAPVGGSGATFTGDFGERG